MIKFKAVIWKEWIIFRNTLISTSVSSVIGPALYLTAFGWGLGDSVSFEGGSYTSFVIPGIIAMNSMSSSFGYIANDINLSRTYMKTFEAVMISPVSMQLYTAARIAASAVRSLFGTLLIILLSFAFGGGTVTDIHFIAVIVLNSLVFSAAGFIAGLIVDTHAGMAKVTNFVITPMSFLCGTFFPVERFPAVLQKIFGALPLTVTVSGLRAGSEAGWGGAVVLLIYFVLLFAAASVLCKRAE